MAQGHVVGALAAPLAHAGRQADLPLWSPVSNSHLPFPPDANMLTLYLSHALF